MNKKMLLLTFVFLSSIARISTMKAMEEESLSPKIIARGKFLKKLANTDKKNKENAKREALAQWKEIKWQAKAIKRLKKSNN
ncbi:MAG: hypothetical protein Q8Q25_02345 [bacterium]|nr:hypothetical protein [bacterium]